MFIHNAEHVGLTRTTKSGQWLGSEPTGLPAGLLGEHDEDDDTVEEPLEAGSSVGDSHEGLDEGEPPAATRRRGKGQAIFVGHGKNKKPLEQLIKILNEYGIPHKEAIEEPNRGRPITDKVAQVMEECGAAILIFTADEEFKDTNDDEVWRPSENVVYELGAASVMYGGRIIIFKEDRVTFPTNFRDIGHIEFQKDDVGAKAIELFRELIAFKIIQVAVSS